jgi:UDPglucose 6-dehydrogenase
MKIGIVGNGFVGSAIVHGFVLHTDDILIYDKDRNRSTASLKQIMEEAKVIFLCLPTPMTKEGKCDLTIIEGVLNTIVTAGYNCRDNIFVLKSTVVPGTTEHLSRKFPNMSFVFNPEFLTERRAKLDFINTSRIVLGGDPMFTSEVESLYRARFPYTKIIKTDFETAELIKYMANCFFSTKISFMNEMKQVCEASGANWEQAVEGFITDGRIGNSHIDVPGHDGSPGFGGKCFPKDINAMIVRAKELGVKPTVLEATWKKNLEVRENQDWLKIEGAVTKDEGDK